MEVGRGLLAEAQVISGQPWQVAAVGGLERRAAG